MISKKKVASSQKVLGSGLIPWNIKLQQDNRTVCCGHKIVASQQTDWIGWQSILITILCTMSFVWDIYQLEMDSSTPMEVEHVDIINGLLIGRTSTIGKLHPVNFHFYYNFSFLLGGNGSFNQQGGMSV